MAVRHDYRSALRFERYSTTETLPAMYPVVIDTQVICLRDSASVKLRDGLDRAA